jgi:hypothetical protein
MLYLGLWGGISFLAMLTTLRLGLGSDKLVLLMTLPVSPAARFCTLYGLILIEGLWNWLLLAAGVLAVSLGVTLGWAAATWVAFMLVGAAFIVWCSAIVTLLAIRYIVPRRRKLPRAGVLGSLGVALVGTATFMAGFAASPPAPGPGSIVMVLLLAVAIGPLAGWAGRLYVASFHIIEGRSGPRTAVNVPGIQVIGGLLARNRNLTSALFRKALLGRSRSALNWARVVAILVYLALFPPIREALTAYDISDTLAVVGYTALLCVLAIIDSAPSPIGGEGNRLTLYLTAPFTIAEILRAKLTVFLAPVLLAGLAITLLLGRWIGLSAYEVGYAASAVALIVVGDTALLVWGSVWDEDLDVVLEGAMQTLLHEEAPITTRRLWLLNMSLLLLVVGLTLVWKLPAVLALPALVVLDGVVLAVAWRFSCAYLRRLLV